MEIVKNLIFRNNYTCFLSFLILFLTFNDEFDQGIQDKLIVIPFHAMVDENHGKEVGRRAVVLLSILSFLWVGLR